MPMPGVVMVNSDSLLSRLLPGLLVAAALFGMWWLFVRDGGSQAVPREAPGVLDGPSSAIPYLLQSSQLGPEYDQKTAGSRPVTSSEMRAGQSPRGLDVVKASWKNGARGSWVQAHGTITVTSEAELFDTSQLGPVSDSIERRMIKLYHGREASSPAPLPAGAWFLTGRTISHMISTYPARRQVAVVGWQHGDVLAVVVITGLPHDGVTDIAGKLATTQDGNIGFAAAGG